MPEISRRVVVGLLQVAGVGWRLDTLRPNEKNEDGVACSVRNNNTR